MRQYEELDEDHLPIYLMLTGQEYNWQRPVPRLASGSFLEVDDENVTTGFLTSVNHEPTYLSNRLVMIKKMLSFDCIRTDL